MRVIQGSSAPLLQNAIDAIAIGLEDYHSSDERRLISSTRNIFAGLSLLFKHKLVELSHSAPDEFTGKQTFWDRAFDIHNVSKRLRLHGIDLDWQSIERINRYRNDIKHFYTDLNPHSVQQLIAETFLIIRDFIREHLSTDPQALLGDSAWASLNTINENYQKEKAKCNDNIDRLYFYSDTVAAAFKSSNCASCSSDLLSPVTDVSDNAVVDICSADVLSTGAAKPAQANEQKYACHSCETQFSYAEIVKTAIPGYYRNVQPAADEEVLITCVVCRESLYLCAEGTCAGCGFRAEYDCNRCGGPIPLEEMDYRSLCGWCVDMLAK